MHLIEEEISLLKCLTQLDILITEQFFLDDFGISLNVAPMVGRESNVLSSETRKRMNNARLNSDTILSKKNKGNLLEVKLLMFEKRNL